MNTVLDPLPGSELVVPGIDELRAGRETVGALLVSIGHPRLSALGLELPAPIKNAEHALYLQLAAAEPDAAHGRYNALVHRLVSFERALACGR